MKNSVWITWKDGHGKVASTCADVREDGAVRRMTAAEACLFQLTRRGMEGDSAAARAAMLAIEDARVHQNAREEGRVTVIVRKIVSPGSVNPARPKFDPSQAGTSCHPTDSALLFRVNLVNGSQNIGLGLGVE